MILSRFLRIAAAALACVIAAGAQAATTLKVDHVVLSAYLERPLLPGGASWIAVRQDIEPGWHTYWRNPGDSGLATNLNWTLPKGVSAGAIDWPTPEEFSDGVTVNYGYAGHATLLVPLSAVRDADIGTADLHVSLLECEHMCIPEDAALTIDLRRASGSPDIFSTARASMPSAYGGQVRAVVQDGRLIMELSGGGLAGSRAEGIRLFAASRHVLADDARPTITFDRAVLRWSAPLAQHRRPPGSFGGVVAIGGGKAIAFETKVEAEVPRPAAPDGGAIAFLSAILFAFLGGLILNVMPCVLPILSMKALMLAQSGEGLRKARHEALAYGAGVLATFASIAGTLIALKAGGAAIGWGFQLQSPIVVLVLALLMAAIGFNLLGTFEVPLSLAGIGDGLTRRSGLSGAFFTGVLAVMVASPCTAPFMGTAVGFALTQSPATAFAIFISLGLGFAAPLAAIAFTPGVSRLIPRPGAWMLRVRQFLAFPMFATAIWLLWVLGEQAGSQGMVWALSIGLGAAFILWTLHLMPGRWGIVNLIVGVVILAAAVPHIGARPIARADGPQWAAWSNASVLSAQRAGRPVLVDFSASWCVTCLVNERLVLDDRAVVERLQRAHVVTLKADWTNRDPAIAAELASHGRDGVPLYLLFPSDPNGQPVVLPQILSRDAILSALGHLRLAARGER